MLTVGTRLAKHFRFWNTQTTQFLEHTDDTTERERRDRGRGHGILMEKKELERGTHRVTHFLSIRSICFLQPTTELKLYFKILSSLSGSLDLCLDSSTSIMSYLLNNRNLCILRKISITPVHYPLSPSSLHLYSSTSRDPSLQWSWGPIYFTN